MPLPGLTEAMERAGFFLAEPQRPVGIWSSLQVIGGVPAIVTVDLLVPDALGGVGRRAARLDGGHGKRAAMKVHGLEAAVVDTGALLAVIDAAWPDGLQEGLSQPVAVLLEEP